MKVVAAYLLAVLGGNPSPTADDIKNILESGTISFSLPVFIFLEFFVLCLIFTLHIYWLLIFFFFEKLSGLVINNILMRRHALIVIYKRATHVFLFIVLF